MPKKKKKPPTQDSFKAEKEKIKEPKGLLGMKLAEALAKKEMEGSLDKKDFRGSGIPPEKAKPSKHRTASSPSAKDNEVDPVKAKGPGQLPPAEEKSKHRVYVPEREVTSEERQLQTAPGAPKPKIERKKPILPEVKVPFETKQKRPPEYWRPVTAEGKIQIKTSQPSERQSPSKQKTDTKKLVSWQVQREPYSDERDIVIGFDLGTACSKIVLQDKQLKKAFSVPFDGLSYKANRYLLPTKLFVDAEGKLSLAPIGTRDGDD